MSYPKTLYKVVNSLDEEKKAVDFGCTFVEGETGKQEYPKMLYKHPKDKADEHTYVTVHNEDEHKQANKNGFQEKPHVSTAAAEGDNEELPTKNPNVVAHKADSPEKVIQRETGVKPEDQGLDQSKGKKK